jgi:hypothetical protein
LPLRGSRYQKVAPVPATKAVPMRVNMSEARLAVDEGSVMRQEGPAAAQIFQGRT